MPEPNPQQPAGDREQPGAVPRFPSGETPAAAGSVRHLDGMPLDLQLTALPTWLQANLMLLLDGVMALSDNDLLLATVALEWMEERTNQRPAVRTLFQSLRLTLWREHKARTGLDWDTITQAGEQK